MDGALEQKLKRLMLLRVVMITTLLLVAVYVETVSETLLRVNPLYFLIAATYALTLVHAIALRFVPYRGPLIYGQVIGDLLVITGLVYVTGGTRAGFILLYPISVLSGSVLVYRRQGLVLAGVATVLYGSLLWAVRDRPRPAPAARRRPAPSRQAARLLDLRHRRGVRDRGHDRLLPLRERAERRRETRGGRPPDGGPPGAQQGHRRQHPQRPRDHRRRLPRAPRQSRRRGDPRSASRRAAGQKHARGLRLAALRARGSSSAGRRPRPRSPGARLRARRRREGRRRDLGLASRDRGAGQGGLSPRVPGPDRGQEPGARGADQGEARRGG